MKKHAVETRRGLLGFASGFSMVVLHKRFGTSPDLRFAAVSLLNMFRRDAKLKHSI